jgi:hypothetical protein
MKILSYSGETVVTTDLLSDAVVDYARALAADNAADVIDIPVVTSEGTGTARLLIGPSSQLISTPSSDADVDLADAPIVADIQRRIGALGPRHARVTNSVSWDADDIDLDSL